MFNDTAPLDSQGCSKFSVKIRVMLHSSVACINPFIPQSNAIIKTLDVFGNKILTTKTLNISKEIIFIGEILFVIAVLISCPIALHIAKDDETIPTKLLEIPVD